MMERHKLELLQEKLGCRFSNREKIGAALTHASTGADWNYERLEFLGDRVLGLVLAHVLYTTYPQEPEGDLAKRHAALVQGKTLAHIARGLDLGAHMKISDAERHAGGGDNDNILADGLEALIGALYLDCGLDTCHDVIGRLWADAVKTMHEPPQDPKTALQEWAQGRGLPLPDYAMVGREGPDHAPLFDVQVTVEGFAPVVARGASRRAAEKEAARLLLTYLKSQPV